MMPVHAIVLAAGLGTRMRPLTLEKPKPLIAVAGVPLIDWCLNWLAEAGITQAVVNTSYLAEQIETYVANRVQPRVQLSREEPAPLETGGGIAKALPLLGDGPFVAMNSDAIFIGQQQHPIQQMAAAWDDAAMDFCMVLVPRSRALGWEGNGDFVRDEATGRIRKPQAGEAAEYIFTGVEMMHPRVFANCPRGAFSLNHVWNASRDAAGVYQRIHTVVMDGQWLNVGDLAGHAEAERAIAALQAAGAT